MFLTGFDSKPLNTLYVDKNLKYHGLIQAFSRTNRVYNDKKPFGNIICFRNLKRATDEALALFSNKETTKIVLVPSYAEIEQDYQAAVSKLFALTPNYQSVDDLVTEEQQLEFIKAFREVMRYNAQLQTFIEYDQDQTALDKQHFANFASKYADLCRAVRKTTKKEKVSVLDDVDFQLDLLHSDRINVGYIINLLQLIMLQNLLHRFWFQIFFFTKMLIGLFFFSIPELSKSRLDALPIDHLRYVFFDEFLNEVMLIVQANITTD